MLTRQQKLQFHEQGWLKIPGAVPKIMVEKARRAINHSVGNVGRGEDRPDRNRDGQFCDELRNSELIVNLFNKTPLSGAAGSLLGKQGYHEIRGGQIALRFPMPPMTDPREPNGHLDGLGNGRNGQPKGSYRRGFSMFAVVYLSDVPDEFSGNFTLWPKSHAAYEAHFKKHGHEVLSNGLPRFELPEKRVMVTGEPGDAVLAHYQMMHGACPNASSNIRYAAIFRVRSKRLEPPGFAGYTDIWHEFPGVQKALEPPKKA